MYESGSIKTPEIESLNPVDSPRYQVYCLTPSEHGERASCSHFFRKKKELDGGTKLLKIKPPLSGGDPGISLKLSYFFEIFSES